ncbi:hypothetical protein V8E53_003564 [Lactarius tabidus]
MSSLHAAFTCVELYVWLRTVSSFCSFGVWSQQRGDLALVLSYCSYPRLEQPENPLQWKNTWDSSGGCSGMTGVDGPVQVSSSQGVSLEHSRTRSIDWEGV